MALFVVRAPAPNETEPKTRFGGRPLASAVVTWPKCRQCSRPLQFVSQLRIRQLIGKGPTDGLVLLWQCTNAKCSPDSPKATYVLRIPVGRNQILQPPSDGKAPPTVERMDGIALAAVKLSAVPAKLRPAFYAKAVEAVPKGELLGMVTPDPVWLRGAQNPICEKCSKPMRLLIQLEDTQASAARLDGGRGYVFACTTCPDRVSYVVQK